MNAKEAKKIMPKAEYEAFEAVLTNQISRTPAARLMQRATLSRRLRDKYRDLARRQAADALTRRTNEIDVSLHERRARIFQEIIDRLEEELDRPRKAKPAPRRRTATTSRSDRLHRKTMRDARRREK